ncbi:MAG: nicotinate-nicotinamide nucleotide adenylyltransferase [Candidatus Saccharimonadales bacterium]
MKIGIFAGTFDPIHNGHIAFAVKAVSESDLERVVIVAEKSPYRKKPLASWDHRQAMIERATENIPEVDHDYEFSNQLAHQHTMEDMLSVARKHYGSENEFWFLVGSDVFEHMKRWQSITEQHEYGGFVVALRDDHSKEWLDEKIVELRASGFSPVIRLIENHHPHISSKKIRDIISGQLVPDDLPDAVYQYSVEHQLYTGA